MQLKLQLNPNPIVTFALIGLGQLLMFDYCRKLSVSFSVVGVYVRQRYSGTHRPGCVLQRFLPRALSAASTPVSFEFVQLSLSFVQL